ncbi:hypothetical protein DPMN_125214 [Dreissena polymorpha]|uniref:Uncharacterized protein n=1 Tax=Dreissena polymorpha TaxID=45954 RepID=A0A9D4JSW7_DREPO|nr:hypothetical protein DPMN_125214 [Dreissena polymorpha]
MNDRLCSAHFVDGLYNKNKPVPSVFTIQDREKRFKTTKTWAPRVSDYIQGVEYLSGSAVRAQTWAPRTYTPRVSGSSKDVEFLNRSAVKAQTCSPRQRYLGSKSQRF